MLVEHRHRLSLLTRCATFLLTPAIALGAATGDFAGLMAHQVITAATLGGASAIGLAKDLGTVEEGKLADLVVLDADLLKDIRNTPAMHRVIKGEQQ